MVACNHLILSVFTSGVKIWCGVDTYNTRHGLSFAELCKLVRNGCSISRSNTGDKCIGDQYWLFLKHKSVVKENGKSETPSETSLVSTVSIEISFENFFDGISKRNK